MASPVTIPPPEGVVVVDKPAGITSHDVVGRLRRIYGTKRVGHTGTLDPLATGVLVLCLGQATRIVEYLTASAKEYRAGFVFGVTTDSEDVSGAVLTEQDASHLQEAQVRDALETFRGPILQTPPMVSALHHEGKRLYELARKGLEVERAARPVEIYRLELLSFTTGSRARAEVVVECSTGTYIRTLAADIGRALGVGGMMETLRRSRVGSFTLDKAHSLGELEAKKAEGALGDTVIPIERALSDWPAAKLSETDVSRIRHGQPCDAPTGTTAVISDNNSDKPVLMLNEGGAAVGIARLMDGRLEPVKVFSGE
jgi:tRNA pseudouridine55 synthase